MSLIELDISKRVSFDKKFVNHDKIIRNTNNKQGDEFIMAWMFDENSNHTRQFISFTECTVTGNWDITRVTVRHGTQPTTHDVYRALGNGMVDITLPNGMRRQIKFRPQGLISIEQSILTFRQEDVEDKQRIVT